MAPSWKECIVYAFSPPRNFQGGILGAIDLYEVHLLLDGQGKILREQGTMAAVEARMRKMLESQDMPILSVQAVGSTLWIQVDPANNPVHEQVSFREVDGDALCWRTILYPCQAGTTKECLGFTAPAAKDSLGGQHTVASVMERLLVE